MKKGVFTVKIQHGHDCFDPKNTTWGKLIRSAKRTKRRLCLWWKKKCVGRACANISGCEVQILSTALLCGMFTVLQFLHLCLSDSLQWRACRRPSSQKYCSQSQTVAGTLSLYLQLWSCAGMDKLFHKGLCVLCCSHTALCGIVCPSLIAWVHLQTILLASPKKEYSSVLCI